jgi:hypothetical protein
MLNRRSFALSVALSGVFGASALAQPKPATSYIPNHPSFAPSLEAMKQGRWKELIENVAKLPPQSAYTLLRDIGDGSPLGDNLNTLGRIKGGAGVAGAILVGWAWRYRGKEVQIDDEEGFAKHLIASSELLMKAIDNDPDDGVAATFLSRVLKATGETQALRDVLPVYLSARRKPVEGLAVYSDAISEKWAGSEVESLAFARRYANSAPPASFGVIPDVHLTAAGARLMSDDPKVVASVDTYFAQPEVVSEIVAAHENFRTTKADTDSFAMLLAHSQFSFAFGQMRDVARTRYHLNAQGAYVGGPWRDVDDASTTIAELRASIGLGPT